MKASVAIQTLPDVDNDEELIRIDQICGINYDENHRPF